ncbi:glycosyltransferase family 4 protein [Candidatus Parcubacteria bacterium]|nr:glycosyltransferase family 4 protein [Candidatus Parcubacteria bacterium]
MSQFSLIDESIYKNKHRISVDYFHGKPDQQESFRLCFEAIRKHHGNIARVRVSTKEMGELIKTTGIDPKKVMRIPIAVDTELFTPVTAKKRAHARARLGISESAVVVGSFQKDGNGWDEGNEPKLIKGPDIFLKAVGELKQSIPNLHILLSGPARGYVKNGLDKLSIPYHHEYLKDPNDVAELYDALDLYIIASREEGGPKACLDSMAKGIPLVTTKVGQCADLVVHGKNGMMTPIEDTHALAASALEVLGNDALRNSLRENGILTALENNHESQLPLWKEYLTALVD